MTDRLQAEESDDLVIPATMKRPAPGEIISDVIWGQDDHGKTWTLGGIAQDSTNRIHRGGAFQWLSDAEYA